MALEIVACVFKVSTKIYATVDEVQANKKRCLRLSERIRCLIAPLEELVKQTEGGGAVYKEALIDLVRTLEEARQFLKTFIKGKSVLRRVQDVCYAKRVKEKFEFLNDRLNSLVPALTFGLQVESRRCVQQTFSAEVRMTEDTKDESNDMKDIQHMLNSLGMPSFQYIRSFELRERKLLKESLLYNFYTAQYRLAPVVLKKPRFEITAVRREHFFIDAKNMLQFNSENVVRVFGVCVDSSQSYMIVTELMSRGSLRQVLESKVYISDELRLRMCLESARGLYFVHCCEVLHRNLTSHKYLVNEEFHVKISGFEFSSTESFGQLNTEVKQSCCQPPELNEGGKYTERSDIYSYGLILCEILSNANKSKNNGTQENALDCNEQRHLPENLNGPEPVMQLARDMLNKDQDLRPTMEETVRLLTSSH
uniref:Mixed lineage kinase domain-like protein n=1 Tax=Ciona intestinalis TaxID=7719 RepID=F7ACH1_CIOIN|nr:mixed lineage kinase domain-like protein [Ciona intestinalis]|eukprot:XP_002122121.1 mixed lineage kinase domain-like protein [Ciona intestinalis]